MAGVGDRRQSSTAGLHGAHARKSATTAAIASVGRASRSRTVRVQRSPFKRSIDSVPFDSTNSARASPFRRSSPSVPALNRSWGMTNVSPACLARRRATSLAVSGRGGKERTDVRHRKSGVAGRCPGESSLPCVTATRSLPEQSRVNICHTGGRPFNSRTTFCDYSSEELAGGSKRSPRTGRPRRTYPQDAMSSPPPTDGPRSLTDNTLY